jgi:hypothetical protein
MRSSRARDGKGGDSVVVGENSARTRAGTRDLYHERNFDALLILPSFINIRCFSFVKKIYLDIF